MAPRIRAALVASATGRSGLLALGVAAVAAALRYPALLHRGFVNHDVGGILYESMLLRAGGLPYVDAVELKAPLAFYLAAMGLAGPSGRDIAAFQASALVVSVVVTVWFAFAARRHLSPGGAAVAVTTYLLVAPVLDSMDANYVTWALPPALGAVLAAVRGGTSGRLRWFAVAGASLCWAVLARRQGIFVIVPVAVAAYGGAAPWGRAILAAVAGGVGALLPFEVHYALRGHPWAFVEGVVFNPWGYAYVSTVTFDPHEALRATAFFLAWPLAVALVSLGAGRGPSRPSRRVFGSVAVAYLVAAVAAAWVGGRFYKGYFLMAAPAACFVAGIGWDRIAAPGAVRWRRWIAAFVFLLLGGRQAVLWSNVAQERGIVRDRAQRRLAERVARTTGPGDRIWCWGWHLWDVYALSRRLSASRIYKGLGLLTEPHADTWRTPAPRLVFRDGPAARMLLEDFRATPPAVVILGSTVPHRDFHDLRRFLRDGYRRDPSVRMGRLEVWVRRPSPQGPSPRP